ncbi:MAG: peptidoglycan DD-metalloendopeptidase family protein [Eubacterium sp.]|nr:peptidoglycan DD-metalloendopeptidase family protein [Eubacterium sp.]
MKKALFGKNLIKKITAAFMVVILLIPYCSAIVTLGDNKSDLQDAQNQQNNIQNKKKETEDKIAKLKEESTDLNSLIQGLDAQMGELSASLDDINTQIEQLEAEIEETEAQLEQAEIDKESQYQAMKLRIQFMYEHNDYTYIEVLLTSQSMADMLNKFEYINKISEYDRQMLEEYQSTINMISSSKVKLEEDRENLTANQESLQAQLDALEVVQNEKTSQLNALKKNTSDQEAYKKQLEADEKKLESEIASITAKIKAEEESGVTPTNRYDGGKFKWPTISTRITSPYGDTSDRTSPHKGVDIGAVKAGVSGDPVYAAYDGKVVIAHRQSEYYSTAGNYLMIYHGNGLYTRYLHLDSLSVSVGQQVTKGQKLGVMGNTGNSFGAHLHFDVMLNGSYVNPMTYFN